MMKITYVSGYSKPIEITVQQITCAGNFLKLITDNDTVFDAECIQVSVNGNNVAYLSENA